jgi:hypothetical protein
LGENFVYAAYYSLLQKWDSVGMEIELPEINIQINLVNGNKCIVTDRKNDSDKKEDAHKRRVSEEKVRMLQKRDAERNRYRQMTGEVRARMLQKKRDAKRNRYRQITGEEKARILQKKRDAERNRYSKMTGEEKVRMLHRNRNAKRNRYNQMTNEEKARMLVKKRVAARNRYNKMTYEEKARMLQKKKQARQIRLDDSEKTRMNQKKKVVYQSRYLSMKSQEGAEMLQKGIYAEQNGYMEMKNEDKVMILEEKKQTQQSRLNKDCVHVTSDFCCQESTQIEPIWGEAKKKSTIHYNTEICSELDNSICTASLHVVCDYCQAKKWNDKPCSVCCCNGEVQFQPIGGSHELLRTYRSDSDNFMDHMGMYNSDFQMTSFGVSRKVCHGNFMPKFKIHRFVYHLAGSLLSSSEAES